MPISNKNESMWYQMTSVQVAQELQVDLAQGLSTDEALARLKKYGPNILGVEKKRFAQDAWIRLYRLSIPLTLFAAALLSLLVYYQYGVALFLAAVAIVSMLWGVYPDFKTGMSSTQLERKALVRRDGQLTVIDSSDVVPGDIAILTAGTRVPADGRMYMAARLSIDETFLTGNSSPTWKTSDVIENTQARLDERINMAFMSTSVKHGYGTMIVTSTGMNTELGRISGLLNRTKLDKNPVQRFRRQMTIDFARLSSRLSF